MDQPTALLNWNHARATLTLAQANLYNARLILAERQRETAAARRALADALRNLETAPKKGHQ